MQDGEVFVTGRLKDLIIVRGVNFYPQDIERTMQQSHPRLRLDCGAAFTFEDNGREQFILVQEIERHKHGDLTEVFSAIRRAVASEFELTPDAIVLIRAGSVPKTSSGKIQRHACRDGYLSNSLDVVGQWNATDAPAEDLALPSKPVEGKRVVVESHHVQIGAQGIGPLAPRHLPSKDGKNGQVLPTNERLTQLVVEEIRRVAKERANGMTLDSPIVETGMDSLERMEILASLEEKFGGRFPEEILPELETTRHVVAAVEKYLGTEPREVAAHSPDEEVPEANYEFDKFPEYIRLCQSLNVVKAAGLGNPFFVAHDGPTADTTIIDGQTFINFSSYNYLGMSGDPKVNAAAKAAIDRYGTSTSASRLVSGQKIVHVELEQELTHFLGTEDTIALVGGHATNESVIGHLMGPGDLILHDALAHNSIVQGCILSGARRRPFPHNDWGTVDRLLTQYRHEYRRILVAIEGVYSMDGDIPELAHFVEVKKRHKVLLMVDEAHSMGTLGATGHGIAEYAGVDRRDVDIWMGTLSKSLGSGGGYISGTKALVDYLRYTLPGFVFAAGMPPSNAAAALCSLRLLESEPNRVAKLQENSKQFLKLAKQRGLNTGMSKDSPVVPIILGNSIHCLQLSKAMLARGVNVQPIVHPAVEENASRLRYFITAKHEEEQLRYTVDAMVEELEKIDARYLGKARSAANVV
jgi:8-amino-7-oxononanoate synthase